MSRHTCLNAAGLAAGRRPPPGRHAHCRCVLFRWLHEVCRDFRYSSYTHTVALMLTDSHVARHGLDLDRYQLVGITALCLAAKLEERTTRRAADYALVTDGACTAADIVRTEHELLACADYGVCARLPHMYFCRYRPAGRMAHCGRGELEALFACALAAVMERGADLQCPRSLCLEAIREMERVFDLGVVEQDTRFYLGADGMLGRVEGLLARPRGASGRAASVLE